MVNNVNSSLLSTVLSNSLSSQSLDEISSAITNKTSSSSTISDLTDEGSISEEALKKYQTEQEISYYTTMLNAMLGTDESPTSQVSDLISQVQAGTYGVNDELLADSMGNDEYLRSLLGLSSLTTGSTSSTGSTGSTAGTNSYENINELMTKFFDDIA